MKDSCDKCPSYSSCLDDEFMRVYNSLDVLDKAFLLYFAKRISGYGPNEALRELNRVWDAYQRKKQCRCRSQIHVLTVDELPGPFCSFAINGKGGG